MAELSQIELDRLSECRMKLSDAEGKAGANVALYTLDMVIGALGYPWLGYRYGKKKEEEIDPRWIY